MDESESGPALWTSGNLLLAGLPLECGCSAVAAHLERVAQLGRTVSEHGELIARFVSEIEYDVQRSSQEIAAMNGLLKKSLAILDQKPIPQFLEDLGVVQGSFRDEIEERLDALMAEVSHDFGIPVPVERAWALGDLGACLLRREQGLLDAVESFPERDRARWSLEGEIPAALRERLARIDPEDVLFGLQELMKVPWSMYGGMVVGGD